MLIGHVYKLVAKKISRHFDNRKVLSEIDLDLTIGQSLAITGPNGSGKSTLIQIMLGLLRPTKGDVQWLNDDGQSLTQTEFGRLVGFVSPYLSLYDQLTAEENIKFFASVCGTNITGKKINELLIQMGLEGRGGDLVGEYSSGMKQRLKYAVAVLSDPPFLFFDEPTSNLDEQGQQVVIDLIEQYRSKSIIVIATNETREYELAGMRCLLG